MVESGDAVGAPPPAAGGERKKRSRWGTKEEPGEGAAAPGGDDAAEAKRQRKSKVKRAQPATAAAAPGRGAPQAVAAHASLPICGVHVMRCWPCRVCDPRCWVFILLTCPCALSPAARTVGCRDPGGSSCSVEPKRCEPDQQRCHCQGAAHGGDPGTDPTANAKPSSCAGCGPGSGHRRADGGWISERWAPDVGCQERNIYARPPHSRR